MTIRSPGMLGLAVALLATAGVLAALRHDGAIGVAAPSELASMQPGDSAAVKGDWVPFFGNPVRAAAWRDIDEVLGNRTFAYDAGPEEPLVLATGTDAPDTLAGAVAEGRVLAVLPHPDETGRLMVVLGDVAWRDPLFR